MNTTVTGLIREVNITLAGLIREMRPWQWYKQIVVLFGIFFSGGLTQPTAIVEVLLTAAAFCLVASAMYVINDINDVEEDRNHPEKKHRPIASGQVSVPVAAIFGVLIGGVGLGLAWSVNLIVFGISSLYVCQNALYNLKFKELLFIDILVVAIGFVLRALAGVYAINLGTGLPSPWLVVCTLLAALMLAIGKRKRELRLVQDAMTRRSLEEYRPEVVDRLLIIVTATLLVSYSLYTFFGASNASMATLPFAYFAVFRYHHLIETRAPGGGIERLLLRDSQFLVNCLLWVTVLAAVIYLEQPFTEVIA